MLGSTDKISDAANRIRSRWQTIPRVGLILGTGLGGIAEQIENPVVIRYEQIPNFPVSTVETHTGQLVCGHVEDIPLIAMEGRFHYYEGYSMQEVIFPVRVMQELGVEILIATNAAGSMNPQYGLADLVVLDDHINLMPDNPLRGPNDERHGPRFPDMSRPYDPELISLAKASAAELGIQCHEGVLAAVAGPNLETRAEYRMLRLMGADVVSMSTVPEVIAAVHGGLRVLAFSIVTDMCLPDELEPVAIEKIVANAGKGGEQLSRLIPEILKGIA